VRVDYNGPLKQEGGEWKVTDLRRIQEALPTIQYIMEQGGRCILASHLGRPPKGGNPKSDKKYSLEPVGQKLSELLNKDVILTEDCIGDGPRSLSQQMRNGDVMLLENLRFNPGEEENSPEFVNRLLQLCDVYVSDAFGTLHRAHASTVGLPMLVGERAMGLLVEKELHHLAPLRENPARPFVLVMGGSKVSDKIGVLEHFLPKVNHVFIGGAMAYAFLKAQGREIGRSLCEDKQVTLATRLLKSAAARNVNVLLPVDHVVTRAIDDTASAKVTPGPDIPADMMGVDIGPKTLKQFASVLDSGVETIFWNGPVGVFEQPAFAQGTNELAKLIASSKARKLAGGGDVAAAIAQSGCEDRFDFISTGGGATLEYLEGKELPGLKALEVSTRSS
jgi:phosphoglycerate kinase